MATPGMNPPLNPQMANLQKYASMSSMASMGYLPPGHGYVPKKFKPDKPYGLSFMTVMNRTHRGPGKKYLQYAGICAALALLFFFGAALYFGHRNVSRMIVLRTEVLGALMIMAGLLLVAIMGQLIYKARVESNRWRFHIRFRPEGLNAVAAINAAYVPEIQETQTLQSGTYGKKALREIPKPKHMKKKSKSKMSSGQQTPVHPQQAFTHPPPQQTSSPAGTLLPQPARVAPQSPLGLDSKSPPPKEGKQYYTPRYPPQQTPANMPQYGRPPQVQQMPAAMPQYGRPPQGQQMPAAMPQYGRPPQGQQMPAAMPQYGRPPQEQQMPAAMPQYGRPPQGQQYAAAQARAAPLPQTYPIAGVPTHESEF